MTTKMLQAISQMLEHQGTTEISAFKERVKCAKLMLDKIIEGLNGATPDTVIHTSPIKEPTAPPKHKPQHQGQYKVIVDTNQKLSKIEGLPLDAKIVVDGKAMTHQQALGKTFNAITLPD